jgi:rhamnose utilization protein RhaD (predicted bifunctional aldolase and dehydrogenase)
MNPKIKKLIEISNHFGKNPEFVIAGGGNTSYKNEDFLWIKASGTSLATITEEGFVKMFRSGLKEISGKNYSPDPLLRETEVTNDLYACIAEKTSNRPSVETSLHNLLNFSYVVHTHPTIVNALMCSANCAEETRLILGEKVLLVEYTDPGYVLFKLIEKKIKAFITKTGQEPKIIFLQNHGVFVAADTTEEIVSIYKDISARIRKRIISEMPSFERQNIMISELAKSLSTGLNLCVKTFESDLIKYFTKSEESFRKVDTAFSPDNIVYCKAHYLFTQPEQKTLISAYRNFEKEFGYPPKVIALENAGIICIEENEKSVDTVYEVFLDMMKISYYSECFGGPNFMTPEQIKFIDNWEVENYRRQIAKSK